MKNVLVVVDMQKDFIDGSLGTKEAVAIVPNVVKKIRDFDGPIFATLDTHPKNYLETAEGKKLPVVHCINMTDGWLLNEDVMNALSDKDYRTIEKPTFGSLKLVSLIKDIIDVEKDVNIEVVGLCTDICVVSNVLLLKANFPEIKITVDASCCAGVTPETHQAALTTMKMCQIDIVNE